MRLHGTPDCAQSISQSRALTPFQFLKLGAVLPTLVYLISGLGTGEGISCRDAMSAAGSAFSPPGSCTALEVMLWRARSLAPNTDFTENLGLWTPSCVYKQVSALSPFLLGREYRGRPPDIIQIHHLHKATLSLWQIPPTFSDGRVAKASVLLGWLLKRVEQFESHCKVTSFNNNRILLAVRLDCKLAQCVHFRLNVLVEENWKKGRRVREVNRISKCSSFYSKSSLEAQHRSAFWDNQRSL